MFQKQSNASLLRSLLGKLKLKNSSNVSRIHKGHHQLHSLSVNSACFVLGSLTNSQTVTSSSFRDKKKCYILRPQNYEQFRPKCFMFYCKSVITLVRSYNFSLLLCCWLLQFIDTGISGIICFISS